jgi:hypothetical protein
MRGLLIFLCLAAPAHAETLSQELRTKGLAATEARIAAITTPAPEDLFALGALRFLGGIETALQARWQLGVTDSMMMLPVMRLPIPENPAPQPFDPALVTTIFTSISARMEGAREPLAQISADADFGVEIALGDIWFDINANTARDPGEDAGAVFGPILMGWQWDERDPATPLPTVRFDAADAVWLLAYTHLLQGISETVIAYDPTVAITRMVETRAALGLVRTEPVEGEYDFDDSFGEFADILSVVMGALDQQPDADRLASAHTHFLAMVAQNRRFWPLVNAETDNASEWIPNDAQQSALGITLPPGAGKTWLAVLDDAEGLLQGTLLIPYWRTDTSHGVNLNAMFTNPAPIDLIGWIQGYAAVPYIEQGRTVSGDSWMAFEQMMAGDALLFTVFLN